MMSGGPTVYTIHLGDREFLTRAVSEHTGPDSDDGVGSQNQSLLKQLKSIPRDAQWLQLADDVPTDGEWETLGAHFTSVQNLEVEAGWNEGLNDGLMPLHWPLTRLLMSSSCGEVTRSPHVLLGKVRHLIFMFTMGVRFEGPTSGELRSAHSNAIAAGEKEEHHVSDTGLKITYLPTLVDEWMQAKYAGQGIDISENAPPLNPDVPVHSESTTPALTKFEIIENDAMGAFFRFMIALPRLAHNLRTLNIRSTNGCDLNNCTAADFLGVLAVLDQLETLVLTLGEVFDEDQGGDGPDEPDVLPTIYKSFPSNIKTLRFRGPMSLTQHASWPDWISKFGDPTFLPRLECLSFACDMKYVQGSNSWPRRELKEATAEDIRQSREKCEQLLDAFRGRQYKQEGRKILTEPFFDQWAGRSGHLHGVNPLWDTA